MDLRRRAQAGEPSLVPLARRYIEQVIAIKSWIPLRTTRETWIAYYAYVMIGATGGLVPQHSNS
jgi:hypothetical protein